MFASKQKHLGGDCWECVNDASKHQKCLLVTGCYNCPDMLSICFITAILPEKVGIKPNLQTWLVKFQKILLHLCKICSFMNIVQMQLSRIHSPTATTQYAKIWRYFQGDISALVLPLFKKAKMTLLTSTESNLQCWCC